MVSGTNQPRRKDPNFKQNDIKSSIINSPGTVISIKPDVLKALIAENLKLNVEDITVGFDIKIRTSDIAKVEAIEVTINHPKEHHYVK